MAGLVAGMTKVPDGQISDLSVQPSREKYFAFHPTQITRFFAPSRAPQEGRFAIVTDVGRGMRWT
jgi:hypothetical protein